jgi:hypothetical protein
MTAKCFREGADMIRMNAPGIARILTLSGLFAVGLAATTAAPASLK